MKNSNRRGVLLLVVLALLAMFAMVAVAFVVLTGVEKQAALRLSTADRVLDPADKTLNQAYNIVVRGTPVNPNTLAATSSAIIWQSLLEKIYGFETIGTPTAPATMTGVSAVCSGQLIEFTLPTTNPDTVTFAGAAIDPFQHVGCVVTMLSGPAAGLSSRIVGINPISGNVQMVAFDGGVQPANGNQYIVNGFPYSGMGFGFSSSGGSLSSLALLPNAPPSSWGGTKGIIPGGVNGDYTAADYTDPLIALAISNTNGGISVPIPSLHRSDLIAFTGGTSSVATLRQVMFRPNWIDHPNFTGSNPTGTFTLGSANFNPTWDGISGNPNQYSWDVNNDGSGIPDSVWVDLGMPVRYTSDGQAYKPLFAILCLDMDGRLNLNAHGNYAQTQGAYYQAMSLQPYTPLVNPQGSSGTLDVGIGVGTPIGAVSSLAAYFAGPVGTPLGTSPFALPRGTGTGTAEVNLLPLFRTTPATPSFLWNNYQYLLSGNGSLMGRYGPGIGSALPGIDSAYQGTNITIGSPLTLNNAFPYCGVGGGNYWMNFALPVTPLTPPSIYDAYGSPPDPQAMGAVALDRAGRPLYISLGGPVCNGPYDIDLTRNAPHAVSQATVDNPFGVAEMERILRCYDRDSATLPQRLANLTNSSGTGSVLQSRRAEFTTESEWVPCASAVLPPSLRTSLPNYRSLHPVDILTAKVAQCGGPAANINAMRLQLLPWEILQGLKMDLNRPFGAGAFSAVNGTSNGTLLQGGSPLVPDQPGTTGEQIKQYSNATAAPVTTPFNYTADAGAVSMANSASINDSLSARQLYARHLYVLALALSDTAAIAGDLSKSGQSATYDDVTRLLAQWAVNVVAYRDHNGIMIPFPYDPNPFAPNLNVPPATTVWNPDNTPQHTVWGCKRPELLITETLAFHDVRTQDLNNEVLDLSKSACSLCAFSYSRTAAGPVGALDTSGSKDPSFNSAYRPQGSLFIELYNPWTVKEPRTSDLSGMDPTGVAGVQLNKVATAGARSSPVWRLVIVDPSAPLNAASVAAAAAVGDELPDPDNPIVANRPTIERAAYFVKLAGMSYPTTDDLGQTIQAIFCLSPTNPALGQPLVVLPSGYAVVGSGDPNQQNRTFIGFQQGQNAGNFQTTRMVTLNQADLVDARVVRNTADPQPPPAAVPIPKVLGIDFNFTSGTLQRLSVSEPTAGYWQFESTDGTGTTVTYNAATGQYSETLDIPVDYQRCNSVVSKARRVATNERFRGLEIWKWLFNKGTIPAFRIIYLQRLADPTRPFVSDIPGTATYVPNPQQWNPYRTIDAMTVDLTTFNGLSDPSKPDPTATTGAPNVPQNGGVDTTIHFEAHQRGEKNYLTLSTSTSAEMSLWKQEPADKSKLLQLPNWGWTTPAVPGAAPTATDQYFNQNLSQTLGYVNAPFWPTGTTPAAFTTGDPQYPFPWLNWSYRPFNNEYELLLVPTVSSSKLLARSVLTGADPRRYFGYVDGAVRGQQPQDVYDGSTSGQVPYPHLLNFFESGKSSQAGIAAQFHRLLAYVGVPSRFANTQLQMNPTPAMNTGSHYFHAPFNRISRFREPGRINLNTVTSPDVLFGALNMFPPLMQNAQLYPAFWDKFVRSRRGDRAPIPATTPAQTVTNMLLMNPTPNAPSPNVPPGPSRFMRPFRTPGGAFLTASGEPARENDLTLLRADPDTNLRPLFEVDDYLLGPTSSPTGLTATPDQFTASGGANFACMDYNRNPYFRYQALQKLGNVFSNHSNVFAVWITVGYFEVTPATNPNAKDANGNPIYPDGFQLGPELGSDSGDILRHRAFYIFDRSIPVGFVRGQDINHQKATLKQTFIE